VHSQATPWAGVEDLLVAVIEEPGSEHAVPRDQSTDRGVEPIRVDSVMVTAVVEF
jgi:hypothetical protein